jgi:hypothetical protein
VPDVGGYGCGLRLGGVCGAYDRQCECNCAC